MRMEWREILEAIVRGRDLSSEQASEVMAALLGGEVPPSVVGAFLAAMRTKGASGAELAGFARAMRGHALRLEHSLLPLVDTCGTGGGPATFNLSTAAAFVACGAGARVAKHGNRAMASRCGSADVLEAAGVRLHPDPERLLHILETVGIVFLFAQAHHPAMRHMGPIRRELGIRTLFNQLGPLANPAGADVQLIGVYDAALMAPMAEALSLLGVRKALVVHGQDGLDEISPCGPTSFELVEGGARSQGELHPADFGLDALEPAVLEPGGDLQESAAILREAISDAESPRCRAVIPGAAAAIWLAGLAGDFREAARMAVESVRSGAALVKLERLVEATAE